MTPNKCPERASGPLVLGDPLTDCVPRTIGVHTCNSEPFSGTHPKVSLISTASSTSQKQPIEDRLLIRTLFSREEQARNPFLLGECP